jgi:hypothetical protein
MATIQANKGKILKISNVNGSAFAQEAIDVDNAAWTPTGADGALVILNAETVQIFAGSVKDYSSIDIQLGGTLQIIDPLGTANPTEIYCIGSFSLEGQILCRDVVSPSFLKSGVFKDQTPYSASVVQSIGGQGAKGPNYPGGSAGALGGAGTNGFGGGGGGGAGNLGGGVGGENNQPGAGGHYGGGGTGGATLGNGTPGSGNTGAPGGGSGGGGSGGLVNPGGSGPYNAAGGGGGMKGKHGGILYLYSTNPITGSGILNISGTNGFNGGDGGSGGSGGGGAGGSGGHLFLKVPSYTFSISSSAGSAGTAGSGGSAPLSTNGTIGQPGVVTIL